ncbi:SMI1/KNR4 family protein [Kitasatospora sp. NPDC001175]|uniref:SMI1/KNR4 family protein n=1 Tax=Kitasatospora sp. NPDC001175 TaxID=3157103 RepID=UPI003D08B1BE
MNHDLARLARLLGAPTGARPKDWPAVARRLGIELPWDYREFIDTIGGGHLDDHLYVLEPDCANENYDLADNIEERAEALEYLWDGSEDPPAQLDEPGARLIAWASTDNGEFLYWLARPGQHPDDWTVMVNEARGDWWEHFDLGFAEFLLSTLAGNVRSEIIAYAFPRDPHSFRPLHGGG